MGMHATLTSIWQEVIDYQYHAMHTSVHRSGRKLKIGRFSKHVTGYAHEFLPSSSFPSSFAIYQLFLPSIEPKYFIGPITPWEIPFPPNASKNPTFVIVMSFSNLKILAEYICKLVDIFVFSLRNRLSFLGFLGVVDQLLSLLLEFFFLFLFVAILIALSF